MLYMKLKKYFCFRASFMVVVMNEEQIRLMLDEAGQDTDYEDENDSEVEDHVEVR